MALTRGFRNNNPGNIDYNPRNRWVGQVGIEEGVPSPRFARFDEMQNGVRAMCKLMQSYRRAGADTVREIVNRYAPAHENKTDKYVENVCKWSGLEPDEQVDAFDEATLRRLIPAMIRQENGVYLDPQVVEEGIARAL